MMNLLIVTLLSILTFILVMTMLIINKREDTKFQEERNKLKHKIDLLKQKELILYLVAEMLHNKKDRDITYGDEETSRMLAKTRRFTPYYGGGEPNENEMKEFIKYLSNEAWIKRFQKPARETDFKVKEWFERAK